MTILIDADHEAGNFSEYTGTATSGGDLSVSAGAALVGSYGISCIIDDTNQKYAYVQFSTSSTNYIGGRFYIDPNGITIGLGDQTSVLYTINSTGTQTVVVYKLMNIGGVYVIRGVLIDDAGTHNETDPFTITDAPHCIEFLATKASGSSGNDATLDTWIDESAQTQLTGVDCFDRFNTIIGLIGSPSQSGTVSGTIYLDDFVLRDDGVYIGPVSAGTQYEQSAGGAMTPSGSIVRNGLKALSGSMAQAGTISKLASKLFAGGLTPAGTDTKTTAKAGSGALTPSGEMTNAAIFARVLNGTLTPSSALLLLTSKTAIGAIAPAGNTSRMTSKSMSGSIASVGEMIKTIVYTVILSGTLAIGGALARLTGKNTAGTLPASGTLARSIDKYMVGTIAASGFISRLIDKALAGVLALSGALASELQSTSAPTGAGDVPVLQSDKIMGMRSGTTNAVQSQTVKTIKSQEIQ